MSSSALFKLSSTSFHRSPDFTEIQAQTDGVISRVLEETGHTSTLLPLLMGNGASRIARTGILALGANATGNGARIVQVLGTAGSLGAEVVAFEGTSRGLLSVSGGPVSRNLWRWQGEGGIRQGLATSGINFTALRGAGWAAQGQNIIFQHAAQSFSMVTGHHVAGAFHFIPAPEGSLAQQLFDAEIMNIQLAASMGAFYGVAPGIHALERASDIYLQTRARELSRRASEEFPFQGGWGSLAVEGGEAAPFSAMSGHRASSGERAGLAEGNVLHFENHREGGEGPPPSPKKEFWYPIRGGKRSPLQVEYTPEAQRQVEALEAQIERAGRGLEKVNSAEELLLRRPDENLVNAVFFHQLRHLARTLGVKPEEFLDPEQLLVPLRPPLKVDHPEALRQAVKEMVAQGLNEDAFRVLEMEIPYDEVLFGRPDRKERSTGLLYIQETIEGALENTVRIGERAKERGSMRVRYMSPSLFERLLRVVHGPEAPFLFYVNGTISRDLSVHLKALGASPVGISRDSLRLEDLKVMVPPVIFTLHDLFHTSTLTQFSLSFRQYAGWVYDLFRRHGGLRRSPFYKEFMDRLADMNAPAEGHQAPLFLFGFTIRHIADHFQTDSQRDLMTVARLTKYQFFFHDLHTILKENAPPQPEWTDWQEAYRKVVKRPLDHFNKMMMKIAETYFRLPKQE